MPTFTYRAKILDKPEEIEGRIEAEDSRSAARELRRRGEIPLAIVPARAEVRRRQSPFLRVSREETIRLARESAMLLDAGMPIVQALEAMTDPTAGKALAGVLHAVAGDIREGNSLAASLAKHPRVFPELLVHLVLRGEESGTVPEAFIQ